MYTDKQIQNGTRKLNRAELWRKANPDAWLFVVRLAHTMAQANTPISGSALVEAVRRKAFIDSEGNDTATNNDYSPIIARWLFTEYPELAPHVKMRRTVYDVLMA